MASSRRTIVIAWLCLVVRKLKVLAVRGAAVQRGKSRATSHTECGTNEAEDQPRRRRSRCSSKPHKSRSARDEQVVNEILSAVLGAMSNHPRHRNAQEKATLPTMR